MKRQIFKPYEQQQDMLLPPSLEEMIPEGHLVRLVSAMIDQIDRRILENQYEGGGTSAYDPQMLLKVIVYAYTQRTFSSRQIAKELRENINYMWLSGKNRPDYRTINRFRGKVMKAVVEEVFYGIVEQLLENGMVDMKSYFVDGTKIEANANRYSYVWKKSTQKYKGQLQENVKRLLEQIDELEAEDEKKYGDSDLEELGEGKEIDSQKLNEAMERINERLRKNQDNKDLKAAKKKIETEYLPRMKKYEEQESILEERNSFSKTDHDATFMRMKEDHTGNGQPKPGYNVQIGTQNQFILGYSIHQRPGDTGCLIEHLEKQKDGIGFHPEQVVADAGYGSEENYQYLEKQEIEGYVKYNNFHQEQKRDYKKNYPYHVTNFAYHEEDDQYECPQAKRLVYLKTEPHYSSNGYESERRIYECQDCSGCPVKDKCTKASGNRRIQIGVELERYRQQARDKLNSEEGHVLRSRRSVEVETVFGRLKQNWGFRRFLLRGTEKVSTEWGILSIAHNIAKAAVA